MSAAGGLKRLVPRAARTWVKPTVRRALSVTASARPAPDFLIIGTKRGGTTSLWNWLLEHPGVLPLVPRMQNLKSSHYFSINYARDARWFHGFFPLSLTRAAVARRHGLTPVAGEASPYYLYDPRIAARVTAALPKAKLIVVLRDPVERAYSHFRERTHAGVERLSFADALRAEPDRLAGELERMAAEPTYYSEPHDWYSYRDRGIYAPQLARWQGAVPAERLLVLRSEDMYADPQSVVGQVTAFLGLPDRPLTRPKRHNYHPSVDMPAGVRANLRDFYADREAALAEVWGRDPGWSNPGRSNSGRL